VISLGGFVMIASLATAVVPKMLIHWATDDILDPVDVPTELRAADINGPINVLLLGTDAGSAGAVAGDRSHTGLNTDSIVLVHIPASHEQVYMISIPRDLYVGIPSRRSSATNCTPATHDKINSAFAYGAYDANGHQSADDPTARGNGIVLTMRTISCLVDGGLRFNGSALVNFDGFDKVVEAVGSVYMCVDEDVWSIHYAADGTPRDFYGRWSTSAANRALRKHYAKDECREFQPWEALDYARQRYDLSLGDSDYGRQRHQQQLLKAVIEKIASPNTLTNLDTMVRLRGAAGQALSLNLNDTHIEDWVFTLRKLHASDVQTVKTYAGICCRGMQIDVGGQMVSYERFDPDLEELLEAVRDDTVFDFLYRHPDWVGSGSTSAPASGTATTPAG